MAARTRLRKGPLPSPQETIEKLEKIVTDGNYYGAQQMYKSTSARYISAERFDEALDILQSGAVIQLKHGQTTCGGELSLMLVETLVKGKFPYNEETLGRIKKIHEVFPRISLPQQWGDDDDDMQKLSEALGAAKIRVDACSSFMKAAIRWSAEFGGFKHGSPELHCMLAEYISSESPEPDMTRVTFHFVRGNQPEKFASAIVNFMSKCYPGEDDVAIARAVLMYLSQKNLRDANKLIDEIKKKAKVDELDFPDSELIKFIMYLLQTLERDALPLFRMLRQNFKSSIDREPTFEELLDEIAEKFFGVRRRNPLQGGLFGDIFKMMEGVPGM
ncbi:hypothetical protein MKX01_014607 [Papaver californicum]|nr:hypothetical protein MKX01_014607 [Papaver californicum]